MNLSRTYAGCSACLVDSGSQRFAGLSFSNTDKVARARSTAAEDRFLIASQARSLGRATVDAKENHRALFYHRRFITAGFRRSDLRRRYLIAYARRGTV